MFTMNMIPKCRGSMPAACAIGASKGTKMKIALMMSSKHPTTSKSALTTSRNCQGARCIDSTHPAAAWGMPRWSRNLPKLIATTRMTRKLPSITPVSWKTLGTSESLSARCTKTSTTTAYTTLKHALSIALNTPE